MTDRTDRKDEVGMEDVIGEFDNLVASCHPGPGGGVTEDDPDFKECGPGCRVGIKMIRSRLTDYDRLKKLYEPKNEPPAIDGYKADYDRLKAEVERLKKGADSLRAALNMWQSRAEKAEAELAAARPLRERKAKKDK